MHEDSYISEKEIDERMLSDGFPELNLLWAKYKAQGGTLSDLNRDQIIDRSNKHKDRLLDHLSLLGTFIIILMSLTFVYVAFDKDFFHRTGERVQLVMAVIASINMLVLTIYMLVRIQRYLIDPMGKLMSLKLAEMLRHKQYRDFLSRTERFRQNKFLLNKLSITDWDNPDYQKTYTLIGGKAFVQEDVDLNTRTVELLKDILGQKINRRFEAGKYFNDLRDGKRSINRFIKSNSEMLVLLKSGELNKSNSRELLEEIKYELNDDSKALLLVDQLLKALEGEGVLGNDVRVRIWQRDPWIDLTHQQEFNSSASLRGVKLKGRGPRGRLGCFDYLDNPAISALDFYSRKGRKCRARIAVARLFEDEKEYNVLFVDGVEGSLTVAPQLIIQALLDYATHCSLDYLIFNKYPLNKVPNRVSFYADVHEQSCTVSAKVKYLDCQTREYLDAFGNYFEPFEYQYPEAVVVGICFPVQNCLPLKSAGLAIRFRKALKRRVNMLIFLFAISYFLWIIILINN